MTWSTPPSPSSSEGSEQRPLDYSKYGAAWEAVVSSVNVAALKTLRATCRDLRAAADIRLASHAIMHGDGIHQGLDVVWSAHAKISFTQRPSLWAHVRVLDIMGSCDCGDEWTPRTPCMCIQSLGIILDHILPGPTKLSCVRVHMKSFRLGFPLQSRHLRASRTVYILYLYPIKPSMFVLPLAPIGGSKEVALSILYDPCSRQIRHTDFTSHDYNPNVNYALQFHPAPAPRLPGWYGTGGCGSPVYGRRHEAGRLGENLLQHLASLAARNPGRGRVGVSRVQLWPGGWFVPDSSILTELASYEGRPWRDVAPSVADSMFTIKFACAQGIPLTSLPDKMQSEHYERAAERFLIVPRLHLEGPCLCGCDLVL